MSKYEQILEKARKSFPGEEFSLNSITNSKKTYMGLCIGAAENGCFVIDLDEAVQEEALMEEIKALLKRRKKVSGLKSEAEKAKDYSWVKEKLRLRLAKNPPATIFQKDAAFGGGIKMFLHIALRGDANMIVNHELVEAWGVSEEELFADAIKATAAAEGAVVKPLNQHMADLSGRDVEDIPDNGLWFSSNKASYYGASVLVYPGFLEEFYKKNGAFFVLPSSVHEVLLLVKGDVVTDALGEMVRNINSNAVDKHEVLSNNVFVYESPEKGLVVVN